MSNPYLENDDIQPDPGPTPGPAPAPEQWKPSMAAVALLVAIAGLFMPVGADGWKFPIPKPFPPFVEPIIDAAKTEGSWVIVVEQTEQRTPEQSKLMRDLPYWQSLSGRGLKWRHYDYDADDAKPYQTLADAVGMPAVFVVGGQGELIGKVLDEFPLPAKDALDAKIKEATGR
jgi:hypothetical protein